MANKRQKLPLKNCLECGKKFQPVRFWQEFCSSQCRWQHWSKKQKRDSSKLALKQIELEERVKKLEERIEKNQ